MRPLHVTCSVCSKPLSARGVATAARCRSCYQSLRAANRQDPKVLSAKHRLASRNRHARQCLDCDASISPYSKRCKKCQNGRPDLKLVRIAKGRATISARTDDSSLLGNAGRRRAQKLFTEKLPCERCGSLNAVRHHSDRDTFNNTATNIQWLCQSCHMKEHHAAGDIHHHGSPPETFQCCYCGVDVVRYRSATTARVFCSHEHYTNWTRGRPSPKLLPRPSCKNCGKQIKLTSTLCRECNLMVMRMRNTKGQWEAGQVDRLTRRVEKELGS